MRCAPSVVRAFSSERMARRSSSTCSHCVTVWAEEKCRWECMLAPLRADCGLLPPQGSVLDATQRWRAVSVGNLCQRRHSGVAGRRPECCREGFICTTASHSRVIITPSLHCFSSAHAFPDVVASSVHLTLFCREPPDVTLSASFPPGLRVRLRAFALAVMQNLRAAREKDSAGQGAAAPSAAGDRSHDCQEDPNQVAGAVTTPAGGVSSAHGDRLTTEAGETAMEGGGGPLRRSHKGPAASPRGEP